MARLCTYLALATIFVTNLVVGTSVGGSCKILKRYLDANAPGVRLPSLSELVLRYGSTSLPTLVGLILGVIFTALLWGMDRSERARPFLPIGITGAFVVCLLHLGITHTALTLAFLALMQK